MPMGATVSRIRIELIFRRCWNLITPSRPCRGSLPNVGRAAYLQATGRRRDRFSTADARGFDPALESEITKTKRSQSANPPRMPKALACTPR
jgi:hypothetical protein